MKVRNPTRDSCVLCWKYHCAYSAVQRTLNSLNNPTEGLYSYSSTSSISNSHTNVTSLPSNVVNNELVCTNVSRTSRSIGYHTSGLDELPVFEGDINLENKVVNRLRTPPHIVDDGWTDPSISEMECIVKDMHNHVS